ncbi:endothelin-converting enzyme 1-like [Amblyomma americanum]
MALRGDIYFSDGIVCDSEDCLKHAYDVASRLNPRFKPCDDFAAYVCSAWRTKDEASVSVLMDVEYAYSRDLLQRSSQEPLVPEAASALKMINRCVDRSQEDSTDSLHALRQLFDSNEAKARDPLDKLVGLAVNWHLPILFNVALLPETDAGERFIYIFPSDLLEVVLALQKAVVAHGLYDLAWQNMPSVTGVHFTYTKEEIRDAVMSVLPDCLDSTDASHEDPVVLSVNDLPRLSSSEGWLPSFRKAFDVTPAMNETDRVVVTHQSLLDALVRAFDLRKAVLSEALLWLISQYACFLACTDLIKALPGFKVAPVAHALLCALEVEATHGVLLRADANKRLKDEERANVVGQFDDIKRLVVAKIDSTTVLSRDAKLSAAEHIRSVRLSFGAEDVLLDTKELSELLEALPEIRTVFFRTWLATRESLKSWNATLRYQLPAVMRRTLANTLVYYDPLTHSLVVSPASLVPPLFYKGGTKVMALGGLGFLMAAQLVRSLAYGVSVWSGSTTLDFHREIQKKRRCGTVEERRWFPAAVAMEVLAGSLHGVGRVIPIKGMEHFSKYQVFYLTACHVTCRRDGSDVHSEECNAAVINAVSFADAFRCQAGSEMNSPREKCVLL